MNEEAKAKIARNREAIEELAKSDLPAAPVAKAVLRAYENN
jgi:hypothetical protein